MNEPVLVKIGYVVAAVFAYELLRWCMALATHEFRVRTGREADCWARDPRLPPDIQATLAALAALAYWPSAPWLMLLLLVAGLFGMIAGMLGAILPRRLQPDGSGIPDDEVIAQVIRLKLKLVAALVTTSPLASILAVAILIIGALIGFALFGSIRAFALSRRRPLHLRFRFSCVAAAGDRFVPRAGYSPAA